MFKIVANSVRDSRDIPVRGEFVNPKEAQRYVRQEFRGLSSYWQVWIENSDGQRVWRGYRSGPGGTGERWTWEIVR